MMPSIRTEGQSRTLSEIQVEVKKLIFDNRSQQNSLIFKNFNLANKNRQIQKFQISANENPKYRNF